MPFKVISYSHRATFNRRNMLPIFFPLIVAPFIRFGFLYVETNPTVQETFFDDTDIKILRVCPFIAYCVTEFKIVFLRSHTLVIFGFTNNSVK